MSFKKKNVLTAALILLFAVQATALVGFYRKEDVWTVYKQNPDWRKSSEYLRGAWLKSKKEALVFVSTPADALYYYLYYVHKLPPKCIQLAFLNKFMPDYIRINRIEKIYLLKNLYWKGDFRNLLEAFDIQKDFRFLRKVTFKGIELYEYDVKIRAGQ